MEEAQVLSKKEKRKQKKETKKDLETEEVKVKKVRKESSQNKEKKEKKVKENKEDSDAFNILDIVTEFEPIKKISKESIEDDGIKVIEPKVNKKKLTVDDITEMDKKKEDKEKQKEMMGERSKFSVWVGNLRYTTTEQELRRFFADCGKVSRINMPVTFSRNKGFAYVDFEDEVSQLKAIAKSEQELIGRNLLIKNAKDFKKDGKKAPALKPIENENEMEALPTLFIGNLSFETTKQDIQEVFTKYGEIKKVRISTFEDTGRCKGYAWIDYKEQESATQALRAFQKRKLNGRSLKVMYASVEATERGNNLPKGHPKRGSTRPKKNNDDNNQHRINIDKVDNPNKVVFE